MFPRILRRGFGNYFGAFFGTLFFGAILLHGFNYVLVFSRDQQELKDLDTRLDGLRNRLDRLHESDKRKTRSFLNLRYEVQHFISSRLFPSSTTDQASSSAANSSSSADDRGFAFPSFRSNTSFHNINETLAELRRHGLIANTSNFQLADISIPGIADYLPYLLEKSMAGLTPALRVSKNRRSAEVAIGIPTTRRPDTSYLLGTLRSLIDNLDPGDRSRVLIVVFMAETDGVSGYVLDQVQIMYDELGQFMKDGLLEILVPSPHYYPDFGTITPTFDDSPERMKWRTKQNLDYAYLMMYCRNRANYYMQLEDDVVTKPGYYTKILDHIDRYNTTNWYLLEYSSLGFIGKLFRTKDLSIMIEFIFIFYKDKPVDWLLDHLFYVRFCNPEASTKECQRVKNQFRIRYKPSLFQHVGIKSSLKGKVQKLRERDFGKQEDRLKVRHAHFDNPPANVSTTLKTYQKYELEAAYKGESVFWGLLPQAGDMILFHFKQPIHLAGFTFRSGIAEHPRDRFFNTSVQIAFVNDQNGFAAQNDDRSLQYTKTEDGYFIVTWCDQTGKVNMDFEKTAMTEKVKALRLFMHSESSSWVILSEIWIRTF